jgi:two-component system CheB/CheR fusion protein
MTGDLRIDYVNHRFTQFTGFAPAKATDLRWETVLHPDDQAEYQRRWQVAAAQAGVFEQEHRLRAVDGSWRWHLTRAVPEHDHAGRVAGWFGSSIDIHQRRRAEARQKLLLTELQHRSKNILAVVRSLLTRTLESSTDLEDFAAHLSGRISALARTQSVLARTLDGAVGLEELVHQEVGGHGGQEERQVTIEGPAVMLTDKVAETVGLALHELATNALKFGGLSTPEGRISITWTINGGTINGGTISDGTLSDGAISDGTMSDAQSAPRFLALRWQESGIDLAIPSPPRSGFGRELIEHGLPYELDARTSMVFSTAGLRCDIRFPLRTQPEGVPVAGDPA